MIIFYNNYKKKKNVCPGFCQINMVPNTILEFGPVINYSCSYQNTYYLFI